MPKDNSPLRRTHQHVNGNEPEVRRAIDPATNAAVPSNPLGDGIAGKAAEKGAGWLGKKLRAGMKNKGTTMTGVGAILGGLAAIINGIWGGDGVNGEQIMIGAGMVIAGVQGVLARDADKSSEESNS